jgi:hypothetical protein
MATIEGNSPREKLDRLFEDYSDKRNITLRDELKKLKVLTPSQQYFRERCNKLAEWFFLEHARPSGIRVDSKAIFEEDCAIHDRLSTIFPRNFRLNHIELIKEATSPASWPKGKGRSKKRVDKPFPSNGEVNVSVIQDHLKNDCCWSYKYACESVHPFILRAIIQYNRPC